MLKPMNRKEIEYERNAWTVMSEEVRVIADENSRKKRGTRFCHDRQDDLEGQDQPEAFSEQIL